MPTKKKKTTKSVAKKPVKKVIKKSVKKTIKKTVPPEFKIKEVVKKDVIITNRFGMSIFVSLDANKMILSKPQKEPFDWHFENEPTMKNIRKWHRVIKLLSQAVNYLEKRIK